MDADESSPVAKSAKVDLPALAAKLTATTTGAAADALAKHRSHTWRKRVGRTFARDLAAYLVGVQQMPGRSAIDAAAANLEASAEGLEIWAYLRGFEAGRKRGEAEAVEAAALAQLEGMRVLAARQHSDGAVNRAEFWRRYFASALGLAETATWEQLRDLFDALRAAARVLGHWRSSDAALPAGGAT